MVSRTALVSRNSGTNAPTAVIAAVVLLISLKVFVEEPLEIASKVVKNKDFPRLSSQYQGFLEIGSHKKTPTFRKWESICF
jgi:hypothetical protein